MEFKHHSLVKWECGECGNLEPYKYEHIVEPPTCCGREMNIDECK